MHDSSTIRTWKTRRDGPLLALLTIPLILLGFYFGAYYLRQLRQGGPGVNPWITRRYATEWEAIAFVPAARLERLWQPMPIRTIGPQRKYR